MDGLYMKISFNSLVQWTQKLKRSWLKTVLLPKHISKFGSYVFNGWMLWYFEDRFLLLVLLIPRALDGNIWNNSVVMVVPKSQPGDAIKFRGGNDTWWMSAQFLSAAKLSLVTFSRPISQLGWQGQEVLWVFFSPWWRLSLLFSCFVMGLLLQQHILHRVKQTCLTAFPLSGGNCANYHIL